MEILRRHPKVKGILHSFSGSPEMADELVKMGWYISFSGVLTFKNAAKLPEVAKRVPLDRMLIETDAPYLAAHPHRGERNDSSLMKFTAAKLAEIKGITYSEVCALTTENAKRIYNIK
jgi:TatD DNase family protein